MKRFFQWLRHDSPWIDVGFVFPWILVNWFAGFGRWGLFDWDTAREILLPRRVLAGDIPFRDFESIYGPVSYQLNALFLWIFGDSIWVDRCVNGGLLLLAVWLISRAAMLCGLPRGSRFLLLGSYLVIFAFPPDIMRPGNFTMPFSQAGVWQVVFLLGITVCLLEAIRNSSLAANLLACFLCGLALLIVRLDSFPAIAFFGACSVATLVVQRRPVGTRMGLFVCGLFLGFLPLLLWWFWTLHYVPRDLLIQRILEIRYYIGAGQSGAFNLLPFVRATGFAILVLGLLRLAARLQSQLCLVAAILVTAGVCAVGAYRDTLYFQYVFILVFLGVCIALWRTLDFLRFRSRAQWADFILAVGAMILTLRVVSGGDGYYVPFLAPILLVSVFHGMTDWSLKLKGEEATACGKNLAFCWCLGFLPMMWSTFQTYSEPSIRYETRWGPIYVSDRPDRSETMHGYIWAADRIKACSNLDERIYSYSPNMPVYALAGRLPVEYDADGTLWKSTAVNGVLRSFAEKRMIEKLEKAHIRWIVRDNAWIPAKTFAMTRKLNAEGKLPAALYFGRQWAPEVAEWMERNFIVRFRWGGDMSPEAKPFRYGYVILQRRDSRGGMDQP